VLAGGLALAVSSAMVVASRLLPPVVHDATARVWIGLGFFVIWIASLAAIALYVARHAKKESDSWSQM
jgi:hypothetical protein